MPTTPDAPFIQKFQDGGRIPEVVITNFAMENDIRVISASVAMFLGHARSTSTGLDIVRKPKVETVPETGSSNKLATETDMQSEWLYKCYWTSFSTGLYSNVTIASQYLRRSSITIHCLSKMICAVLDV